jgi:hypothetical protein
MTRIDVHSHFIPPVYRAALEAHGRAQPDGIAKLPEWSITEALAAMDRLNISTAFLSISSPGVYFGDDSAARILSRQVNEEAANLAKTYRGRFGFFAATPKTLGGDKAELTAKDPTKDVKFGNFSKITITIRRLGQRPSWCFHR